METPPHSSFVASDICAQSPESQPGKKWLRTLSRSAIVAVGLLSSGCAIERGRVADRQAEERSFMVEHGPELSRFAAHYTLAFGVPSPDGTRADFAHEGVIVERDPVQGTHVILTVRHGVSGRKPDGSFVDNLRQPLFTLPTVPGKNEIIQNSFGINAATPAQTRGYVDPEKVIFPHDARLDAVAIPLAALHGYKNYLDQLNTDIAKSRYRLRLDTRKPKEGDPVFVMALDRLPTPHTTTAQKFCDGALPAFGKMMADVYASKHSPAELAKMQSEMNRALGDVCEPPFRFLRRENGFVADQGLLNQFENYASGKERGVLLGGFDSLPANSGMPVFSIEDGELRLRGIVKQGGTHAGGMAVMVDSRTLQHEFIEPQKGALDAAVDVGR